MDKLTVAWLNGFFYKSISVNAPYCFMVIPPDIRLFKPRLRSLMWQNYLAEHAKTIAALNDYLNNEKSDFVERKYRYRKEVELLK